MAMSNGAGAPAPVRFGGAGSTSSERDCIIIGEFTPVYNKIRVRLKGIGPDSMSGIDNRVYEVRGQDQDNSLIGVVGRGQWLPLLSTQPEVALALHRGMGDDNGEDYSYEICVCESGEVRGRRQHDTPVEQHAKTLKDNNLDPADLFQYIADVNGVGENLTSEQEFTFTFEKIPNGSTRTPTNGAPVTADEDNRYLMVTVEFDWQYGDAPGPRTMSCVFDTNSGGGLEGNCYVFIGNPLCFWPHDEVMGAIAGVQVLSVDYIDAEEPKVEKFNLANCETNVLPIVYARATDNVGVVAYMAQAMAETDPDPTTQPDPSADTWTPYPPASVESSGGSGTYKAFLWVKDAAGNINTVANAVANAGLCTVTLPA